MENRWTDILSEAGLDARHARYAEIDPRFAKSQREFYEGRTAAQLKGLEHGAWMANDSDGYQLARSYLARIEAAR